MSDAPLPCPFCGHIGLNFSDGSTYRWGIASCSGCGASCGEIRREYPDRGEWHGEAVAEWNRRYTAPTPRKPLTDEQLLGALVAVDPETKRLPPGFRAFARAIEAAHGIKEESVPNNLGECSECHAPVGTVCSDKACPGRVVK